MKVVNITASFKLSSPVNLRKIEKKERPWAKKNRGFAAISLRLFTGSGEGVTALLFSSGSVVVVGSKSRPQIETAREILMHKVKRFASAVVIHNMAFTFGICPVSPELVFIAFRDGKDLYAQSYDPDLFPAVMVRLRGTSTKACIFHSGRINITGCKTEEDAEKMRDMVVTRLSVYSGEEIIVHS